jgi:hypothetical protein
VGVERVLSSAALSGADVVAVGVSVPIAPSLVLDFIATRRQLV